MFKIGDIVISKENTQSIQKGCLYRVEGVQKETTTVTGGTTCFNYLFQKVDLGGVLGKRVSVYTELGPLKPSSHYEVIAVEITKDNVWLKLAAESGNVLIPLEAVKYLKGES